jgi:hypothetical protein
MMDGLARFRLRLASVRLYAVGTCWYGTSIKRPGPFRNRFRAQNTEFKTGKNPGFSCGFPVPAMQGARKNG